MSEEIFKILGKKGVIKILDCIVVKRRKYGEIEDILGNPSTTTRHLKILEKNGIVRREVHMEKYRPVYYYLTEKGKKIHKLVKEIQEEYE